MYVTDARRATDPNKSKQNNCSSVSVFLRDPTSPNSPNVFQGMQGFRPFPVLEAFHAVRGFQAFQAIRVVQMDFKWIRVDREGSSASFLPRLQHAFDRSQQCHTAEIAFCADHFGTKGYASVSEIFDPNYQRQGA